MRVIVSAKDLTVAEQREMAQVHRQTSRMWRNFWIKVEKRKGMSNSAIAKQFGLAESTVRTILKK